MAFYLYVEESRRQIHLSKRMSKMICWLACYKSHIKQPKNPYSGKTTLTFLVVLRKKEAKLLYHLDYEISLLFKK